jgi:hypothetical protein
VTVSKQTRTRAHQRQVNRLTDRLAVLERLSRRFSWARLAVVVVGIAATLLVFRRFGELPAWMLLGLLTVVFLVLVVRHQRVAHAILRHRIRRRHKLEQVARMGLDWAGIPLRRRVVPRPEHPFSRDLDLVGERSVQHLLDTAMSTGGSARLEDWLADPAPVAQAVAERQALVGELESATVFRDRLALAGALVSSDADDAWDGEALIRWLDTHVGGANLRVWLILLFVLAAADIGLVLAYVFAGWPALWLVTVSAYIGIYLYKQREYAELFIEAEHLQYTLRQFRAVLLYLERCPLTNRPGVERLCAPFRDRQQLPSRELGRINWIAGAAGVQRNQILGFVINLLMPWDFLFACLLQRWKARIRGRLPAWLDTWYELEALNSLANFAYLNPDYVMPEIMGAEAGAGAEGGAEAGAEAGAGDSASPLLVARGVGHPLIDDAARVTNDFVIAGTGDVAIITGSNMSGKSTFLRTLGVNLCLAFAGGHVCGAALRSAPVRLFTCIQVQDSVTDGISFFYAEVKRLRALLDALRAAHELPLVFLIDEIFRGTNNRERLIGARSTVRALVGGHGAGVIATHDLELVKLADEMRGVSNYHFREEVEGGRMVFDYRLRKGPSPTTNALVIMRMEGLPVEEPVPGASTETTA